MKHLLLGAALSAVIFLAPNFSRAQTNAPAATANDDQAKATLEKHTKPVLSALKLTDAKQSAKVHDIMVAQFIALKEWHAANDIQIKTLWRNFDLARSAKNPTNAQAALDQISGVYATFKPQHEKFIANISSVLSPAQVETVKDALTINKVKVTYEVYLQIFPALTAEQKAVVLKDLKDAREEAIDCEQMTEKSAFFKKYKIEIEDDYLTKQGYNPTQARKDFAARQKAAKSAGADK